MTRVLAYLGQAAAYVLFAVVVGYLATSPAYTHLEPGKAVIKLSFSHAGEHREPCRRLSQEELNALPPNMRRPTECSRERVALLVELELDGEVIYREQLPPSGLASDGASTAYRKFPVSAGKHRIVARLRDKRDSEGFDYEKADEISLAPKQNLVVDFRPELGGFLFLRGSHATD
jgi:hypothetical protein